MAVFDANALTDPFASTQFNLPGDLQAAQQIRQGQNALTMQAQQVADQQQEVGLRPGLAAGDPQALNALSVIDPSMTSQIIANRSAQAMIPYNIMQRQAQTMAQAAQGVVAAAPADRPAAYQQMLANVRPYGLGQNLPDQYPGDGALDQIAMFGADPGKILNYLQNRPYLAGAAGGQPPSGGASGQNNPGNLKNVGGDGFQSFSTPEAGVAATENQLLIDNQQHGLKTTAQIINSWAPPSDGNDTAAYTAAVAQQLGVDPNQPLDLTNPTLRSQFAQAIFKQEGHPVSSAPAQAADGSTPGSYTPGSPADVQAEAPQPAAAPGDQASAPSQTYAPVMKNGQIITDGNGYQLVQYGDGSQGYVPASGGPADPATLAVQAHIKASAQAGFQLVRDPNSGVMIYQPIPGGPADPAAKHNLAVAGDTSGPLQSGTPPAAAPGTPAASVVPTQNALSMAAPAATQPARTPAAGQTPAGTFPAPPVDPYAGLANNGALATRMNADRTAAADAVKANAPILEKDQQQIQNAQQFELVNAGAPTGPRAGSDAAAWARSHIPWTPSNQPYQTMDKIAAEMKVSGLPSGMGRLDLPVIQAVAKQQPSVTNYRDVNSNIANVQIGRARRDMMYRQAQNQWAQQNGTLAGFDQMWGDYADNVPAYLVSADGSRTTVNTAAPSFRDWVWNRTDQNTGRYNPALASVPDSQLSGGQPQAQSQGQPTPQQAAPQSQMPQPQQAAGNPQSAASQQGGAVFHVANSADYASVPSGARYVSPDGVLRVKQ
ncbi:hypothetical protein [Acidisoma silvae]|uniref:Uncharacterized protein n=1 Tax=Acidisoma silvae TaxID=2802396 RepID=A0A964E1E9_9PROT|nr:hypothetical protein [Acidisoma silvae]MCB8878281.1 hypothetical protein [Acidisoma silvae]